MAKKKTSSKKKTVKKTLSKKAFLERMAAGRAKAARSRSSKKTTAKKTLKRVVKKTTTRRARATNQQRPKLIGAGLKRDLKIRGAEACACPRGFAPAYALQKTFVVGNQGTRCYRTGKKPYRTGNCSR